MFPADGTNTPDSGKMSYTDYFVVFFIRPLKNIVEEFGFPFFQEATDGVSAGVGQLHHACELRVHKHRCFDNMID